MISTVRFTHALSLSKGGGGGANHDAGADVIVGRKGGAEVTVTLEVSVTLQAKVCGDGGEGQRLF